MTSGPALRVELALAEYGDQIAVILAVLGVAALLVSAVPLAGGPPTVQEERATDVEEFSTNLTTNATVIRESSLYESERELTNERVYFLSASPEVGLTVEGASTADGTVEFAHRTELVLEATREETVIWERRRELANTTGSKARAGLNVSEFRRETQLPVRSELPENTGLAVFVAVETEYESDTYDGAYTGRIPLVVSEQSYEFDGELEASETRADETTVSVPDPGRTTAVPPFGPLPNAAFLRAGLGLLLLIVAGGSLRGHWNSRPAGEIRRQLEESQYNEWISPGAVPDTATEEVVELSTLQGVVDVAIDTDQRVIHDEDRDTYIVLTDERVYRYVPDVPAEGDGADDESLSDEVGSFMPERSAPRPEDSPVAEDGTEEADGTDTESDAGEQPTDGREATGEENEGKAESEPDTDVSEPDPEVEADPGEPDANTGAEADIEEPDADTEANPEEDTPTTDSSEESVESVNGIGPSYAERLEAAGIETVAGLLAADPEEVAADSDLSEKRVSGWQETAENE